MIEIHPVTVRVGDNTHLAAQAVNTVTGVRGPLLSAEGCNFDDTDADQHGTKGPDRCARCYRPVQGEET